jgi:hypothetical protein
MILTSTTAQGEGTFMGKEGKDKKPKASEEKKKPLHIPLIPIPDDKRELEEEMLEAFQEDQVRHKHGATEPERD